MIVADNEDPKAISYYRQCGFQIRACRNKFAGSRLSNTRKVKRFTRIVVSPKCKNVIRELKDLTYKKDAKGNDEFMVTCSVPALGKQAPLPTDSAEVAAGDKYMMVTDYEMTQPGQKVAFTIRPEKIRITTEIPDVQGRKDINVFKGFVQEPVYTGFQTKFYVKLENGALLKVFQQHRNFMDDGPDIEWKDEVYVSWSAEDAYIVEDIEK